jgi:hypothetical protein
MVTDLIAVIEKAWLSMRESSERSSNSTSERRLHDAKQLLAITLTDLGMAIRFSEQTTKASASNVRTDDGDLNLISPSI